MMVYDMDTQKELESINEYSSCISGICKIDDSYLVRASYGKAKLSVLNINTFELVQNISTNQYLRIFNFNKSKLMCPYGISHMYDIR
jgi:hypothetical protein